MINWVTFKWGTIRQKLAALETRLRNYNNKEQHQHHQ